MSAHRLPMALLCGFTAISGSLAGQTAPPADKAAQDAEAINELMALLNTPIQSASKREQKAIESPQAIEVISADQIKASGAFRLADILRLATSVQVYDAVPDRCNVTIRGVDPGGNPRTVQILVDGVPMFNFVAGPIDINALPVPIDAIERIEIVRGPSSSLYGANAQTGVIAITTRRAKDGVAGSLRAGVAEHGMNREQAYFSYGGPVFALTAGVGAGRDSNLNQPMQFVGMPGLTVPQNTNNHYLQAFVRPEFNLGSGKLWFAAGVGDGGHADQISYSDAKPAALVPQAIFPDMATTRTLYQLGWSQTWSPTLRSELKVGQKDYVISLGALVPDPDYVGSPLVIKALEAADPALATSHDFYHDTVTETSLQLNWDPSATFHLVAGADTKSIKTYQCLTLGLAADETLSASGGFFSADWTLGQATLSLGARMANESLGGSSTSPRASLVYKLDDTSVLRAGYFTSTRSPMEQEKASVVGALAVTTSTQIANPALKPEKVSDLEVGYRKTWSQWNLDLTYFNMNISDLILNGNTGVVTTVGARSWPQQQYINAADSFTDSGFELAITGELAAGWVLGFNASTVSFKDPIYGTGNQADYSPKDQANLWTRYRNGRFFAFGALQYVGSYTVVTPLGAATLRSSIDAFPQVHFNIGYEFLKGLSVSAYGLNAARPVQQTSNAALINGFGIRYEPRELGLQAAYRF